MSELTYGESCVFAAFPKKMRNYANNSEIMLAIQQFYTIFASESGA